MTTASVLIVMIVATAVGGLVGMIMGDAANHFVLVLLAGFFGVIAAAVVRNYILVRVAQSGPDDSGIPGLIVVYSAVASVAGSLAAEELGDEMLQFPAFLLGALAGLLSAILMVMLMVTYHMSPDKPTNRPFS